MGTTVLQVGDVPPPLAEALTARYHALVLPISVGREDFLTEHGASVKAIVDAGQAPVDAELMDALPNLGAIIHCMDGYDTIDIDAARRLGIGVSNTADAVSDSVADTAVGLMLMTVRGFGAAERYARAGRWSVDGPYPLTQAVTGSRVGILGLGHIGSAIAHRLSDSTVSSPITIATNCPVRATGTRRQRWTWRNPSRCWWWRPPAGRTPRPW
jgi:lactate dehydrogenase-like 2-hydroxyacid dehydrogenase